MFSQTGIAHPNVFISNCGASIKMIFATDVALMYAISAIALSVNFMEEVSIIDDASALLTASYNTAVDTLFVIMSFSASNADRIGSHSNFFGVFFTEV